MTISIFDIFSIGIGPSSSHTVGPMRAAKLFLESLNDKLKHVHRLEVMLYGSLAFTGKGHGTDTAILMGLLGEDPETIDPNRVTEKVDHIAKTHTLNLLGKKNIPFHIDENIIFNYVDKIDYHSNAMRFSVFDESNQNITTDYYFSIGGGFITKEGEEPEPQLIDLPYPFNSAAKLLAQCEQNQLTIAQLMLENEKIWRDEATIRKELLTIANVMEACINRGCKTQGELPGRLNVRRRAPKLYEQLKKRGKRTGVTSATMRWLDVFAMAVNEENAAGGRIVTAPTNGAAGIIPAVLNYYKYFIKDSNEDGVVDFLLTAGAIGILYKKNASISGAEMGCQGEVGVACSMAAGALAAVLGGSIWQIENAAEIGMEHNLGLTCDPVAGLVQIPCIERNAMGAVKAVNAAQLALAEDGKHKVTLDMVINTMYEIGKNMNSMYKETSKGGLAVNVPEC